MPIYMIQNILPSIIITFKPEFMRLYFDVVMRDPYLAGNTSKGNIKQGKTVLHINIGYRKLKMY